jgi:hypothetical protein
VLSGCVRGYRGRCPQRKRKSRRKRRVQQLLAAAGGRARGRWLAEAQRWLSTDHAELAPTAVAGAGAGGGGGAPPLARAAKEKRAQGACVLLSFRVQFASAPNPARPRAGGRSGGFVEPAWAASIASVSQNRSWHLEASDSTHDLLSIHSTILHQDGSGYCSLTREACSSRFC